MQALYPNNFTLICEWINQKIILLTAILTFLMLMMAGILIFFRYVINYPITWGGDILLSSFVWISLLGVSIAFRQSLHVRIDTFVDMMPERLRTYISIINKLMILCFCIFLVIEGIKMVLSTRDAWWGALELPPTYFYIAFPVSFCLMVLYEIDEVFKSFIQYKNRLKNMREG